MVNQVQAPARTKPTRYEPLDTKKKEILKSLAGSASTRIDLNKVRDDWK